MMVQDDVTIKRLFDKIYSDIMKKYEEVGTLSTMCYDYAYASYMFYAEKEPVFNEDVAKLCIYDSLLLECKAKDIIGGVI